jgi:hypothetical protein
LPNPEPGGMAISPGRRFLRPLTQVSPPLARLPGSDQPTTRAGTAKSEPHRGSTVLPRPVGLAGRGLGPAGDPEPQRPSHPTRWRFASPSDEPPSEGRANNAGNRLLDDSLGP